MKSHCYVKVTFGEAHRGSQDVANALDAFFDSGKGVTCKEVRFEKLLIVLECICSAHARADDRAMIQAVNLARYLIDKHNIET